MILAFVGAKGGQGKTTLAVRLSAWLALAGHRTLVVDLVPTASASQLLGFLGPVNPGAGEVLGGLPAAKAFRETPLEKLTALPADPALGAVGSLPSIDDQAARLAELGRGYDFVVLDAPPSMDGTARAALVAADWAIVPVVPDELGAGGLATTLAWIGDTRRHHHRAGRLAGVVVNQAEERVLGTRAVETRLRKAHARDVFRAVIRRDHSFRTPATLARIWERPNAPKGADQDVVALRSELLKLLVRRA